RALALRQIVGGGVGNRVGPANGAGLGGRALADRSHGERAAERVAGVSRHTGGVGIDQINVVDRDVAGGQKVRMGGVFGDRAAVVGRRRRDGRRLVGAGDGDGDVLRRRAAVAVVDGDGELLGRALALRQIVGGGVGNRVGPANGAGLGG